MHNKNLEDFWCWEGSGGRFIKRFQPALTHPFAVVILNNCMANYKTNWYYQPMDYYALQVKTRGEEKFMRLFRAKNPEIKLPLYFPQRFLDLRRGGRIIPSKLPVFPGYVFLELPEGENIYSYQWAFRRTEGFHRFLRSNQDIAPLQKRDLELVLHFIKEVGPLAGKSQVYFDENSRIVVISGPLSGLEGRIVKADKRKGRAKIKLDLYGDSFCIDLAFEVLVKGREFGLI